MSELSFINKLHDDLIKYVGEFNFTKTHPWHRNLVSLYCSIIALSESAIALLESGKTAGLPAVFRTILETYVEFKILIQDRTYGYYMEAQKTKSWLKDTKEAAKGKNPYLRDLSNRPDLPQIIESLEKKYKELEAKAKTNGYKKRIEIKEKFERAGLIYEYNSIYNDLS
ncbi:MAG: hypothetical protein HQL03_16170, partial [Nitrospirae bacterium]|nr:hypothetical protein [Nitrospirota bacterium]